MNWMRQQLLAVIGNIVYFETPVAVAFGGTPIKPIIWFTRDEANHLLVNVRQPTSSGKPRMVMRENFWITEGEDEHDIVCPPSGRLIKASYPNGDLLRVEFLKEPDSWDAFEQRYPAVVASAPSHRDQAARFGIEEPLATVEIDLKVVVDGGGIDLSASGTRIGNMTVHSGWNAHNQVGVLL